MSADLKDLANTLNVVKLVAGEKGSGQTLSQSVDLQVFFTHDHF